MKVNINATYSNLRKKISTPHETKLRGKKKKTLNLTMKTREEQTCIPMRVKNNTIIERHYGAITADKQVIRRLAIEASGEQIMAWLDKAVKRGKQMVMEEGNGGWRSKER